MGGIGKGTHHFKEDAGFRESSMVLSTAFRISRAMFLRALPFLGHSLQQKQEDPGCASQPPLKFASTAYIFAATAKLLLPVCFRFASTAGFFYTASLLTPPFASTSFLPPPVASTASLPLTLETSHHPFAWPCQVLSLYLGGAPTSPAAACKCATPRPYKMEAMWRFWAFSL